MGKVFMAHYELNLSAVELETRTRPKYFRTYQLLDETSEAYVGLDPRDKKALSFLVKAAYLIEQINFQLDHPHNLPFLNYLDEQIKKGNFQASKARILFMGQKGINGFDSEAKNVQLVKGYPAQVNKGFYPSDLTIEQFHEILIEMMQSGQKKKVQNILSSRTVVVWEKETLNGIDYVNQFSFYFRQIAFNLMQAAACSTHPAFNHFLRLQSRACLKANPLLDAWADKKWATLQDTPLEFTLVRENENDEMTRSVFENEKLLHLLLENQIVPLAKDSLGCRVGIINPEGTQCLLKIKQYLPLLAKYIPYKGEDEQNLIQLNKQTMVDADLVALTGTAGEYRGSITIAENLPNDDKLSLKIGGGRRTVYHRQIRFGNIPKEKDKKRFLSKVLVSEQHHFVSEEADHFFTIGHENAHSLGLRNFKEKLGKYSAIIEEAKADMAALAFVDVLMSKGVYTLEQREEILITAPVNWIVKSKPALTDAHSVRAVMQLNYFKAFGAIEITSDNKLKILPERIVPVAQKMLAEIIPLQIEGDIQRAQKFVEQYFVWTKVLATIGRRLKSVRPVLNGGLQMPLAEKLMGEQSNLGLKECSLFLDTSKREKRGKI